MKKKIIVMASALLISTMLCLSACSLPFKKPYGMWRSKDPNMELYIDVDSENENYGVYTQSNGEIIDLAILFDYNGALVLCDKRYETQGEKDLFYGFYKVKEDMLYYTINQKSENEQVIIFEKIGDYE